MIQLFWCFFGWHYLEHNLYLSTVDYSDPEDPIVTSQTICLWTWVRNDDKVGHKAFRKLLRKYRKEGWEHNGVGD